MKFPNLDSNPNFIKIEEDILNYWDRDDTFKKSLKKNIGKKSYVFYDGPPFATGLPHYGSLLQGIIKDVFPRYYTMKGFYVERKFGWDCHGLPVEYELEKIKGIKNKKEIESLGIDKFNEECRLIVLKYVDEWKVFVKRLGRWIDMENDYKTMNLDYMETIWYIFKEIYDKNLIYEGYKSIKICPRCATPLSNTEVQLGYKDLEDLSVVAKFKLKDAKDTYLLAWTTTPWTLPANIVLAINKDLTYVKVKSKNEYYILAKDRLDYIFENIDYEIVEDKINPKDLIGKEYYPLFDISKIMEENHNKDKKGWFITEADFVTQEEGTGIVHIAPSFGEEDMLLGEKLKLPRIRHVNIEGKFGEYPLMEWAGEQARDLGEKILEKLKEDNSFFREIKIVHSYPHCWRCDTPLLNYSMETWFLNVQNIKKDTIKNNQKINWIPEHIKNGRFENNLKTAPDWAISRNRYWGTPLPVWKCNHCSNIKVIGSVNELEKLTNKKITDIHRHFIDNLYFKCEKCSKGEMKRIPEVLDCWFESGSMPYAQKHYPFENKESFEKDFPADFIAEAIDQTRGWFYSLHTIATAIMNKPAFLNVITTGLIQDSSGKKLSKSKKNYTDPLELINLYGADALRLYLISSPLVRGEDLAFKDSGPSEILKNNFIVIYNTLKYFIIYANNNNFSPENKKSENIMDRWARSITEQFVKNITEKLDKYSLMEASLLIQPFIDDISTWYIRRSRERFSSGDKDAMNTLYYVLNTFSKAVAPIIPFVSEYIFLALNNNEESVHLQKFPETKLEDINNDLNLEMKKAREAINILQKIRVENNIKLRQPLLAVYINYEGLNNNEILEIIKEEINVKKIENKFTKDFVIEKNKSGELGLNIKLNKSILQEGDLRELIREIQNIRKKMNLNIKDIINIYIQTEDDDLKEIIDKFKNEIKEKVKSKEIYVVKNLEDNNLVLINNKSAYIKIDVQKPS
jgi:isoleucyl-tRNA synthetase